MCEVCSSSKSNLCEEGFSPLQSWVQIYRLGAP